MVLHCHSFAVQTVKGNIGLNKAAKEKEEEYKEDEEREE
jgi:hypothetical protein